MNGRPRKGHRVAFGRDDGVAITVDPDPVAGLRFTIAAQNGGEALIDFTALRPRRLALAAARALHDRDGVCPHPAQVLRLPQ
jgi:hypothetical protein